MPLEAGAAGGPDDGGMARAGRQLEALAGGELVTR